MLVVGLRVCRSGGGLKLGNERERGDVGGSGVVWNGSRQIDTQETFMIAFHFVRLLSN